MVQETAVKGGVDWEGLGEDGFFAADLGWDGVERCVSHGEWVVRSEWRKWWKSKKVERAVGDAYI